MASEFPKDTIGQPPSGGMVERIKRLLMSPRAEWSAIDAQPMSATGIFTGWAVPLAAIGPVAGLIGGQVFGISAWFVHYRPSLMSSIGTAVLGYVAALIGVWVLALVIDALAPNFGSVKNRDQAMKAAAFSYTAAWIAAILNIIPALSAIALLLGLYSFYLLWIGLPMVMKTPADKAAGYVIVSVVVAIIVQVIISMIVGAIASALFFTSPLNPLAPASGGSVTIGDTTIDTGKMAAAVKSAEAGAASGGTVTISNGKVADPAALQGLLPGSVGAFARTSVESSGGGAMGINVSDATAQYGAGDQSFHVKISDTGSMGALAGLVNVQSSRQTDTGYEKTMMQDGNMVTEKWDNQSNSGTYSVLVAKRFLVEAEGSAPSIDTLKAAVGSVNLGQLAALAK